MLASGFRFYGLLYSIVGLLFLTLVPLTFLISSVLAAASAVAGFYLLFASQLAITGASQYRKGLATSTVALIAFFIAVTNFLSCFIGTVTMFAIWHYPDASSVIMILGLVLLLFGVGSYMIEILFLLNERKTGLQYLQSKYAE